MDMKKLGILAALLMAVSLLGCSHRPPEIQETEPIVTTAPTIPAQAEESTAPETLSPELTPVPDFNFVRVADYIPNISVELRYATADNFTGQTIYDFQDAYLRYGTVEKLMHVSHALSQQGLGLKIWDAFRPNSAQWRLWEICPDGNYVSNPETGSNSHCRGRTVDVTLVDAQGRELEMPSEYDDFSSLADRDYSDCSETAAQNALLLQEAMERFGFTGYQKEWWHFSDTEEYPVDESFDPACISQWYADCQEFISLRAEPSTEASVITRIPAKQEMTLLGWNSDFALVDYQGQQGYVMASYIQPVGSTPSPVGRPASKEVEYYPGNEPETLNLILHEGYGYSIYIPDEGWSLAQTVYSDIAPVFEDVWSSTTVEDAQLKVTYYADYADKSLEDLQAMFKAQSEEFTLTEDKRGGLGGENADHTKHMEIRLYQLAGGVMTVSFQYRTADAEKFGALLWLLADTFGVTEYFWESVALG